VTTFLVQVVFAQHRHKLLAPTRRIQLGAKVSKLGSAWKSARSQGACKSDVL